MYPTQEHVFIPPPPPISTTLSEKFLLFVGAGDEVGEQEARSAQEPRTERRRTESDNKACQLRGTAEAVSKNLDRILRASTNYHLIKLVRYTWGNRRSGWRWRRVPTHKSAPSQSEITNYSNPFFSTFYSLGWVSLFFRYADLEKTRRSASLHPKANALLLTNSSGKP